MWILGMLAFLASGTDGLAVDSDGRVYAATAIGVQVFSAKGQHLGTIPLSRRPQNLAFAGPDKKTLYIVGRNAGWKIQMLSSDTRAARSKRLASHASATVWADCRGGSIRPTVGSTRQRYLMRGRPSDLRMAKGSSPTKVVHQPLQCVVPSSPRSLLKNASRSRTPVP